ncbi:MAG: prolipoprotein diacylglyceryl transferase, partial [Gammaproteobacteria bacterium]|nr:prolipoprotein diacylglyceryl transferase [Gammaproteobacteria bacterium]
FLWRNKMLRTDLLDIATPGAIVFVMGLTLGAFLNGDAYGIPAQLPWSIYLWGEWRHPVQLYELAGLALVLATLLFLQRRRFSTGVTVLTAVVMVACLRVLVDAYRADVPTLIGLRVTQLAGVVIAVTALWLLSERLHIDTSKHSARADIEPQGSTE